MNKNFMLIIFALIFIGCSMFYFKLQDIPNVGTEVKYYRPPQYNEQNSITYKRSYSILSKELLYARVIRVNNEGDRQTQQTVRLIKDKQYLIEIVRGFDKLKSTPIKDEYNFDSVKLTPYVVTMWREGTSVSYVINEYNSDFYYREGPTFPLRKMPEKLVNLLGFKLLYD